MYRKVFYLLTVGLLLALAGGAGAQDLPGQVMFEYWFGGGINDNLDNLKAHPDFPDAPHGGELRPMLDREDWAGMDYFGVRARAFLTPPANGDYTFWVASDDDSELWLSTDADPANARLIANVEGWTNYRKFTEAEGAPGPNRQSAPVTLVAGQQYYIELLFTDGTGGGHGSVAWGGPGIGDGPVVIASDYLATDAAWTASMYWSKNPVPADGAVDVTSPLITWEGGKDIVMFELFLGTTPELGAADSLGLQPVGIYYHMAGFVPGQTYYWRADGIDANNNKHESKVWSFTVMPLTAHFPSPHDGALWRQTNISVSWTAGQNALKHKVYGSTDQAAVAAGDAGALLIEQEGTSLDASALLEPGKTYYWRVDTIDAVGDLHEGPVWTFSTYDPAGGAVAEYFNNMTLFGEPVVVKVVPEINFNWGDGGTRGTHSPDAAINTNNFSARWTANLNVPVSGTYRFYEASDDGARLFLNGQKIAEGWWDRGTTEDASAEIELVAGEQYLLTMEYYENGGGAAAYLRWEGPGIPKEIIPQGALQLPKAAYGAIPGNNAVEVSNVPLLRWSPGEGAVIHTVFLGTDRALVEAGDASTSLGMIAETSITPAPLQWNTTYYWKVDELTADNQTIPGLVWTFKTADFLVVNLSQVTLNYDNSAEPFISELAFDVPADWTANGVADLALRFLGSSPHRLLETEPGTYSMTARSGDVWGSSDNFRFFYKELTGDGAIVAKIHSQTRPGTDWAKAGVMVRESLATNASQGIMAVTPNLRRAFQNRPATGGNSFSAHSPANAIALPLWVKIERAGNVVTAFYSEDGVTWTQQPDTENTGGDASPNPQTLQLGETVYVGFAVTSNNTSNTTTVVFSDLEATGAVSDTWKLADVGAAIPGNDPAPLYVALEDATGATAVVVHPDEAAVNATAWSLWRVPLSAFAGVDLQNVSKLFVGVGDGQPGGYGRMNFADIRAVRAVTAPAADAVDVTMPGDALVGEPNDGDWPGAETPDKVIDDDANTKYLHFKGGDIPVGFVVTPSMGYTVVTGLTFTTANDAAGRDPVGFELYGSNLGIDGPWKLIAKGTVDDFGRPIEWPRFTKTVTPIGFANSTPYANYKVLITALRVPTAGMTQVAEVELLGVAAAEPIIIDVTRANGRSGNRAPVGAFDGSTAPLATEPGGLKDGNIVFSDRTYPWADTPAELVGAEYIRTFNDDKNAAEMDVTYTVTTSREATIALTIDDRIPAEWNAGGAVNSPQDAADYVTAGSVPAGTFVDTGLDLFIKESDTTFRRMSVFAARLPAGTYVFGAMWSNKNFYTIGAMD